MKASRGYSLMEMLVASASASVLVAGLSGALFISVQSLDLDGFTPPRLSGSEAALERMMADIRDAQRVPDRSTRSIRIALADRDGDQAEDTMYYTWDSGADLLNRSFNGAASQTLLNGLTSISLEYNDRNLTAQDVTITPEPTWPVLQTSATAKLAAPASAIVIPTPAGVNEGDLLLAGVAVLQDKSTSLAGPGDWALLSVSKHGADLTQGLWWKVAGDAEAASHSFVWTGDTPAIGFCLRISNQYEGNPITAFASFDADASSTPASPATAATLDNSLIVRVLGAVGNPIAVVGDTGVPAHTDVLMDAAENDVTAGVAYRVQASGGAVKETNFELASAAAYTTFTVVIAPQE